MGQKCPKKDKEVLNDFYASVFHGKCSVFHASALATPAQLGQANAGTGRIKTLRSLLEGSGLRPPKESECAQVHGTWQESSAGPEGIGRQDC